MLETSKEIAYCGLICEFDDCYENCGGCKKGEGCGDKDCYHKKCCREKGLEGCWECADFPCGQGHFNSKEISIGQFIGCVRFIRETSLDDYMSAVFLNKRVGIKYGLGGFYADKTEKKVIELLRKGLQRRATFRLRF